MCCFLSTNSIITQSVSACHQIEKLDANNCVPVRSGLARILRAESCLLLNVLSEKTGMKNSPTRTMTAKRIAVAVAAVCATMSAPSFAAGDDMKALMDLLLKKGVITQQEYDQNIQAAKNAAEDQAFKEKRLADDVAKLNKAAEKNKDTGSVMKNGIGIQSADGANTIQLEGRLHMDYRSYSATMVNPAKDPLVNQLDIRRARLGAKGQFMKDFKYEIQGTYGAADNGMTEGSTIVDVAYMDYAANPAIQFRAGKFKMPFSLEQLTSSNHIDFMERSMANQNEGEYVPAKETGAMLFGSPMSGTSYGLALSRGRANKDALHDSTDVIGRVTGNLAKLAGNDEFVAHIGYGFSSGIIKSAVATTPQSARDESRENNNFFAPTAALPSTVHRSRQDMEYAFVYKTVKAQGEYFTINYKEDTTALDKSVKINYNELLWNITGESHNYDNAKGIFGWIKPSTPFSSNGGLGAWQLGLRYTKFDASDFAVSAGKSNTANALTYGLNWYMNDNVRFMLNYVDTKFDTAVGTAAGVTNNKAVMMRSQIWF
jgi:phosphate-selective porin OprO/OprP